MREKKKEWEQMEGGKGRGTEGGRHWGETMGRDIGAETYERQRKGTERNR
jgi:hypothetical protein